MYQKILVAVDESDTSHLAFEQAFALAKLTQASLMLIHVLSPVTPGYPSPVYAGPGLPALGLEQQRLEVFSQTLQALEEKGLTLLRSLTGQATTAGIAAEFSQFYGDPGQAICTLAKNWQADLIVVGSHGRSGLNEFLWGSVSNFVSHHATCAVLIVKRPAPTPSEAA